MTINQSVGVKTGLIILIVLYVGPIFVFLAACIGGTFTGDAFSGKLFLSLISNPTGIWSVIQKLMVPISAGLATSFLWSDGRSWLVVVLLSTAGVGFLATTFLLYYLGVSEIGLDVWQPADLPQIQSSEQFESLKDQYLVGVMESLATYLVILLGLGQLKEKQ